MLLLLPLPLYFLVFLNLLLFLDGRAKGADILIEKFKLVLCFLFDASTVFVFGVTK